MKSQREVEKLASEAAARSMERTQVPGMTYEEGVRDALDWVLGNNEENPLAE
jgi:hypothetical protein